MYILWESTANSIQVKRSRMNWIWSLSSQFENLDRQLFRRGSICPNVKDKHTHRQWDAGQYEAGMEQVKITVSTYLGLAA